MSAMAAVVAATPLNAQSTAAPKSDRLTIARVSLPGEGRGDFLLADPATNRLFVTHSQLVHVLDLRTLKPLAEVTGLTVAHGVALDAQGRAYVTDGKSDTVIAFDPATGRTLRRIPAG